MKVIRIFSGIILSLVLTQNIFSQSQNYERVPVWGIYLDLTDPDARKAASDISKAGFSRYFDFNDGKNFLVLNTGDISFITQVLRKKRKDGIIVRKESINFDENCKSDVISSDSIIQYKNILNNFYNQFHVQLPEHTPEKYNLESGIEKKYYNSQEKKFKKYVKNKIRSNPFPAYYWLPLGTEYDFAEDVDLSYVFYNGKKELLTLRFDTLPGKNAHKLEAFEEGECADFDRNTFFKDLNISMPESDYFRNYRPRNNVTFGKKFTVNFEKNSSDYSSDDINQIVSFIRDNSYSIISAEVEGYASVEGTYENNQKLMKRRADVLISILEKYNDELIELDTLIVSENWEKFETQIKGSKFEWLLDLSQDSIKSLLEFDTLSSKMEPMLADQRKAILNLKLSQKLSESEKIEEIFKNYHQYSSFVINPERNTTKRNFEPILLGILNYIENMVENKTIDSAVVAENLPKGPLLIDLYFQKLLTDYYINKKIGSKVPAEEILRQANDLYVSLYQTADLSRNSLYGGVLVSKGLLQKLVNVQLLTIQLLEDGFISNKALCNLNYPEENDRFYSLILNKMYFHEKNNQNSLCEERVESSGNSSSLAFNNPNSPFYFLIKRIILNSDSELLNHVYRSDNLLEFDLYWFLSVNIDGWNVLDSTYFDNEVDMVVMRSQLKRLERMRQKLCPWALDQLMIDYHLKVLQFYLKEGIQSKDDEPVIATSFAYLKRYFMSRAAIVPQDLALKVAYQFIMLNNLYLSRDGSEAAYDLLNAINRKNPLSGEAAELYMRLAYYHNSSFLALINNDPPMDYCKLFKGVFSVYPYGKLKEKICQSCE